VLVRVERAVPIGKLVGYLVERAVLPGLRQPIPRALRVDQPAGHAGRLDVIARPHLGQQQRQ